MWRRTRKPSFGSLEKHLDRPSRTHWEAKLADLPPDQQSDLLQTLDALGRWIDVVGPEMRRELLASAQVGDWKWLNDRADEWIAKNEALVADADQTLAQLRLENAIKTENSGHDAPAGYDAEPDDRRKVAIREAVERNKANSNPPFSGVLLKNRGEIEWISRDSAIMSSGAGASDGGLDLRGAVFAETSRKVRGEGCFHGVSLRDANLDNAQLRGANFTGAVLEGASLRIADASRSILNEAVLTKADLTDTNFQWVLMRKADASEATITNCDLRDAFVEGTRFHSVHFNDPDKLSGMEVDRATCFVDTEWDGQSIYRVDWSEEPSILHGEVCFYGHSVDNANRLHLSRPPDSPDLRRLLADLATIMGDLRNVAHRLREAGLDRIAAEYRLKAYSWERRSLRLGSSWLQLLVSAIFSWTCAYGERLLRVGGWYVAVVLTFFVVYWVGGRLAPNDSLVLSLTSFHGRGNSPSGVCPWLSIVAATEGALGLFLEALLIATLARRLLRN